MKKVTLLLIPFLMYGVQSVFGETPDKSPVEIIPTDYAETAEITIFTLGVKPFPNSTVAWQSVPSEFDGFQFFSTNSSHAYKGKIVPSATGTIYLVGSGAAVLTGWTKTSYSAVYESASVKATTVYVFERSVNFGDTIDLPTNNYWAGFSPIAYSMSIKDEVSSVMKIEHKENYVMCDKNYLKFSKNLNQPFDIWVYDINGKVILQKNITNNDESINVGFLNKGIYLVRLYLNNQFISQKIMKNESFN